MGFAHIGLICRDIERTRAFYLAAFAGAREIYAFAAGDKKIYLIDIGGGAILELLPLGTGEPESAPRWAHIAVESSDVPGDLDRLLRAGATIKKPLAEGTLNGEPPLPTAGAFVFGPEGETIELFQFKTAVPW